MRAKTVYYYYSIYDDTERYNHFRSTFPEKKIRSLLKKYEKRHQRYLNAEFTEFLKQHDPKAELIEVTKIFY